MWLLKFGFMGLKGYRVKGLWGSGVHGYILGLTGWLGLDYRVF